MRGGVVGSTLKEKRFELVDVYPLTFEPELAWGRCFEKEASLRRCRKGASRHKLHSTAQDVMPKEGRIVTP